MSEKNDFWNFAAIFVELLKIIEKSKMNFKINLFKNFIFEFIFDQKVFLCLRTFELGPRLIHLRIPYFVVSTTCTTVRKVFIHFVPLKRATG